MNDTLLANPPLPAAGNPPEEVATGDLSRRFVGVARLHGSEALRRFSAAHVVVVGVGGVGSWAAEALARSAVGCITLIDLDHIAESNTNRQVHALGDAYGQAKVQAMAARIADINPACVVHSIEEFVTPDNVARVVPVADVVIDCIDQVDAKAALIAWCVRQCVPVITCGAGGGRFDPTRIRSNDLARAAGDPLLAKLRYRLRRHHGFPREGSNGRVRKFDVLAVFSDEPVQPPRVDQSCQPEAGTHGLACSGYGSNVTVTAPLGFAAAAATLTRLARPR
jgi:tRNA A37 threonylcarbamoyladenosine dehydratase